MFKGMVRNGLACNLSSDGVASKMEMIKISGLEKEPRFDQISATLGLACSHYAYSFQIIVLYLGLWHKS